MCDFNFSNYDETEHCHRFAVWAATRSAQRGLLGFDSEMGQKVIEASGLYEHLTDRWNQLPVAYGEFKIWHKKKREQIINEFAEEINEELVSRSELTHGRAAKLINVYMKASFSEISDTVKKVIHPPVDRQLLENVKRAIIDRRNEKDSIDNERIVLEAILLPPIPNGHRLFNKTNKVKNWTELNSDDYEAIINAFHDLTDDEDLWKIEMFWPEHQ